ncbi:hypothetical protein BDV30DRAFT_245694 [Aspergillus minisclerotigenes]|uniref:Zn(2)-C6 fungal-type domain-containing protein n=1 Tax=Aspergillus minisclerotigenes TaxID=656917 RepID=A0A5N6IPV4_9EURO|nr:hypothetical protein BDV30DRAFT_245694 [Aspergillus minisclerotigenes]
MTSEDHLPALAPGPRGPVNKQSFTLMKPRKNSTACLPCKQAKRKCTGRPAPCKACQNTDAECVFDETLDLRRKVAARRTLGELEYYRGLLYSLLESLRSSDEDKVNHILETIRGSALLSNVANVVDAPADLSDASSDNSKPLGNTDDAIAQQERLAADAHSRITLEKLCDIPVFQVPVKPWTAVTDDDHLVSHLISLYFTWDHPLSQIVDQRVFLRHMREGKKNTEFCTPFLVNSILAIASTYSDFPEVFAIPGDVASKGAHFFNEAELLWKAEEGRPSLANIQALALMSHVLKLKGKPDVGWLLLRQAVQLGQDFGFFQAPRTGHRKWRDTSVDMRSAGATAAWGLFILNSQISMECRKTANLKPPIFEPPGRDNSSDDIVWIPYPRSNHIGYEKKSALLREIMIQTVGFTELVVNMQDLLFDEAFDMNIGDLCRAVSAVYTRLETWLDNLPRPLKIDKEAVQVPQVLSLHIRYHHAIIQLFDFLMNHEDFAPMSRPSDVNQARLIRLQSAKQIADYLLLYHEAYGLRHVPGQMLEPANASTLILLAALDECEDNLKEEFIELCRFLVAFSKRFSLARDMLANIESTAESKGIKLPPEAGAVFDHRNLESSQWL